MTTQADYLTSLSPENASVLFIDSQTSLMLGTQSIDTTLLTTNTAGLAQLAALFKLPVVLTTTGGGGHGPAGPLIRPITEAFPDVPIIDRMGHLNAMDDPRFATAVAQAGRPKVILSGITTDFCLVYPAMSLVAAGYHVFVAVDASGSWTKAINDAALQRMIQMGVTPTNVQSIAGELLNSASLQDPDAAKTYQGPMMEWLGKFTPAPALIGMAMQS
jgi:nicotinamidase-related amidase